MKNCEYLKIVARNEYLDFENILNQESHILSWQVDWAQIQMQNHYRSQDQVILRVSHLDVWVLRPWTQSNQITYRSCTRLHHKMDKKNLLLLLVLRRGNIQVSYVSSLPYWIYLRASWLWWTSDVRCRYFYLPQYLLLDRKYCHAWHRHLHCEILFLGW